MPTALEIKPMPNADGIGQTALDGIENEIFGGFWAQNHQKLTKKYIVIYIPTNFNFIYGYFYVLKTYQMVEFFSLRNSC